MNRIKILLSFFALFLIPLAWSVASAQENKLPFPIPRSAMELPRSATVVTNKGSFVIEFFREIAPITVRNFEYLAKKNFYNNLRFHRYVPNFVIQGGDPQGNGKGGTEYRLPPEFTASRNHIRGTVGMARLSNAVNPERLSNGSQFYISLTEAPHLDALYTIFGQVEKGLDTVDKLRIGDQIVRVELQY